MDADIEERQRDIIARREKRWSMNSQRLEQIVAELMRPIGDLRRSFDTDLSALLEEYLTEAGLHALEDDAAPAVPNFAELALLLQQSANIYGRKVDLLYQHVLECSESLHTNTETQTAPEANSPVTPHGTRRKRRASAAGWARIDLEPCAAARREPEFRPPPTLPRMYVELEPRVLAPCDVPLIDYAGEPVGLLQDFNVTWRLHGGLLVDELECGEEDMSLALRAIPLSELQAAIEAAAPPSPPPPPMSPEPPDDLPQSSTPIPAEEPPPPPETSPVPPEPAAAALAKTRKRRHVDPELYEASACKIHLTSELRVYLREQRDFSLDDLWVSRLVARRAAAVRAARERLTKHPEIEEFRGFDEVDMSDLVGIGGFLGWTTTEVALEATDLSLCLSRLASVAESDDDGFFEQSSFGSEGSRPLGTPPPVTPPPTTPPPPVPLPPPVDYSVQPEWVSWRAGVVARAAAGEAKGLDVRALGAAVIAALPAPGHGEDKGAPAACDAVLRDTAKDDEDVSRLFLATLFLANAGNVEVTQGPPLTLNSFSLRLVSADERRYCAAADADPAFLAR